MELSGAARRLRDAVRTARQLRRPADGRSSTVSVDEAYLIQQDIFGDDPAGWKLGLLSPAKQLQMGLTEPIYGRIPETAVLSSTVELGRFMQPKIEPELAAVLGADIPPGASDRAAAESIDRFVLAVDVLDSAWRGYRFSAVEVIADNASGGAAVCGADPVTLTEPPGTLRLSVDGTVLGAGDLADLAPPGPRLAWLATCVGGLRAGQRVLLGSPTASVPAVAGELLVQGCGRELTVLLTD